MPGLAGERYPGPNPSMLTPILVDVFGLSAEDSAVLHSLMDIEFLG